jgi:hypothetical protein
MNPRKQFVDWQFRANMSTGLRGAVRRTNATCEKADKPMIVGDDGDPSTIVA